MSNILLGARRLSHPFSLETEVLNCVFKITG